MAASSAFVKTTTGFTSIATWIWPGSGAEVRTVGAVRSAVVKRTTTSPPSVRPERSGRESEDPELVRRRSRERRSGRQRDAKSRVAGDSRETIAGTLPYGPLSSTNSCGRRP